MQRRCGNCTFIFNNMQNGKKEKWCPKVWRYLNPDFIEPGCKHYTFNEQRKEERDVNHSMPMS